MKLIGRRFKDYYDYLCYQYQDDNLVYDRDKTQNQLDKDWEKRLGNFPRVIGELYRSEVYHPTEISYRKSSLKNYKYLVFCDSQYKGYHENNQWTWVIDKPRFDNYRKIKDIKSPIAFVDGYSVDLDICLRSIQFNKVLSPEVVYTQLYNWLSAQKDMNVPEAKDEIKIQAHGFDKKSFRNMK